MARRLCAGSAGAGLRRGGDGLAQTMLMPEGGPYTIGINAERTRSPACGLSRSSPGPAARW